MKKKLGFIFPGQGTQYIGMGKNFYENFTPAKLTFQEADDILTYKLSDIILNGPEDDLLKTTNSQLAIFVTSIAILRTLQEEYPKLIPAATAGLSLGEYSALFAADKISFSYALLLLKKRARFMHEASLENKGAMAAVLGMETKALQDIMEKISYDYSAYVANFNYPGQVVITGTLKGVQEATKILLQNGARKIIPLKVEGAFHSPLMKSAKENLSPFIKEVPLKETDIDLYMNVTGKITTSVEEIKQNLINQVTNSVLWEQTMENMIPNVDCFVEIGPRKTLSNMLKKSKNQDLQDLDPKKSISIENINDISSIEKIL
jgi:[acyl-carrier-protein] S-malonyltransferase